MDVRIEIQVEVLVVTQVDKVVYKNLLILIVKSMNHRHTIHLLKVRPLSIKIHIQISI